MTVSDINLTFLNYKVRVNTVQLTTFAKFVTNFWDFTGRHMFVYRYDMHMSASSRVKISDNLQLSRICYWNHSFMTEGVWNTEHKISVIGCNLLLILTHNKIIKRHQGKERNSRLEGEGGGDKNPRFFYISAGEIPDAPPIHCRYHFYQYLLPANTSQWVGAILFFMCLLKSWQK